MQCLKCRKLKLSDDGVEFQQIHDDIGIELQLSKLLLKYFDLNVQEEPNPSQAALCPLCVEQLINLLDADEYKKQQKQQQEPLKVEEDNHQQLPKTNDSTEQDDDNVEILEEYLDNHNDVEEEFLSNRSDSDVSMSDNVKYSEDFIEIENLLSAKAYVCSKCGNLTHKNTPEEWICNCKAVIYEEVISAVYCCECCREEYKSCEQLLEHLANNQNADCKNKCPIYGLKYDNLAEHSKEHDYYDESQFKYSLQHFYVCSFMNCHETFSQLIKLQEHRRTIHEIVECKNCQKLLKREQLDEHIAKFHRKSGPFKCQFCDLIYKSKMSRSVHIARSHKNQHICTHCRACFNEKSALVAHVDYMHVPVECKKCLKKMKNQRNYELHDRAVHQKVQRYMCRFCDKGYYYRNECNSHEKRVHDNIAYKCADCNFVTNYEKSYDFHLAMHNNQLPFVCSLCDKSFARKQQLTVHVMRHNAQKPYKCSENDCNAAFYTNNLLKKHIMKCQTKDKKVPRKHLSS